MAIKTKRISPTILNYDDNHQREVARLFKELFSGTNFLTIFTATADGLTPKSGGGTANFLRADGTWDVPPGAGASLADGDYGDIVVSGVGTIMTIDAGVVTLAKMANMATGQILGRLTAGVGSPEVLTATQVTAFLNVFTAGLKGEVPASGGGAVNFLRADGTWAPPATSGTSDPSELAMLLMGA